MQSIMRALVISMLIWGFTAALNVAPAKEKLVPEHWVNLTPTAAVVITQEHGEEQQSAKLT